jgi:hypothetical protein
MEHLLKKGLLMKDIKAVHKQSLFNHFASATGDIENRNQV